MYQNTAFGVEIVEGIKPRESRLHNKLFLILKTTLGYVFEEIITGCHLVLKPGAEGNAQKSGRVVVFLDDCIAVFIFQAKLSSDFHSPQNSDVDHGGKAVFDTAEDGERTVVTNAVGDGSVFIKSEAQPLVSATYGK